SMLRLIPETLNEFIWISQAPAFNNVLFGAVPVSVEVAELKKVTTHLKNYSFYRIDADALSGTPDLGENVHVFDPKWYEIGPVAHAMVRRREDIVEHFKNSIKSV
ncbi:MAG: hypothetical protein ACI9QC_000383, partial [Oceanicoccus sp.]